MRVDMCAGMCTDMCADMCTDMCADMCIDMCAGLVQLGLPIDVCRELWPMAVHIHALGGQTCLWYTDIEVRPT